MTVARRLAAGPLIKTLKLGGGEIVLWTDDLPAMVVAKLDDGYPQLAGEGGGWTDAERPGQTSATVYRGAAAPTLPLRLVLGGWPVDPKIHGMDCGEQITLIRSLARPPASTRGSRPPLIRVRGPVPHGGALWFVDGLEWGADAIVVGGHVRRTGVTVTLKRYVPIQMVAIEPARRKAAAGQRHTVKKGEQPGRIVQQRLGVRAGKETRQAVHQLRWGEGRWRGQPIRDPRQIRAGDVIILPPRKGKR